VRPTEGTLTSIAYCVPAPEGTVMAPYAERQAEAKRVGEARLTKYDKQRR
jgi:hypothetical protein